jgi:hypothetical protein
MVDSAIGSGDSGENLKKSHEEAPVKATIRIALIICLFAMAAPAAFSTDFDFDTDGPWVNVDIIDLSDYGDATYLEYLGKGYVAMLDALKTEGLILDFGVMMKTTGDASDGDVVVWWSIKTLADYEKAFERMETLAGELHTDGEWGEIWVELQKVRVIKSTNLYRQVLWTAVQE